MHEEDWQLAVADAKLGDRTQLVGDDYLLPIRAAYKGIQQAAGNAILIKLIKLVLTETLETIDMAPATVSVDNQPSLR